MSSKAKRKSNGASEMTADLDQIREILFGEKSRDTDEQLGQLADQLQGSIDATRSALAQQIADLDSRLKRELSSVRDAIRAEKNDRINAIKSASADARESADKLRETMAELEDRLDAADEEVKSTLLSHVKSTAEHWRIKQEELNTLVEEEVEDIRINTADRSELSELFRELGQRINGELKKPAPKA